MQISNLLLLAFGAGVLANPILPSNEHNNEITDSSFNGTLEERSLEKRGTYGWVGVYATPDCSGDWDDTPEDGRPKIHGDCIKFSMEHGQYLGINWGSGELGSKRLAIWNNAKCAGNHPTIIAASNRANRGPNTCWDRGEHGVVRSVMDADSRGL